MALKELKRFNSEDKYLNDIQANVREFTNQLNKKTLDGNFLESITIGTSTTLVPHALARSYLGWSIADLQGDARVWRDTTSTADTTKFIPLKASSSVIVNLWVF